MTILARVLNITKTIIVSEAASHTHMANLNDTSSADDCSLLYLTINIDHMSEGTHCPERDDTGVCKSSTAVEGLNFLRPK